LAAALSTRRRLLDPFDKAGKTNTRF